MNIRDDCRINISPDVVSQELNDETVLLDLKSEVYFSLDEVGTRFWQLAGEYENRQKIIDQLLEEYDVDADVLNKDIDELLSSLVDAGLVSLASTD